MGHHHHEQKVPLGALIGAAVLLLGTLALAAHAKRTRDAEPAAVVAIAKSLELRFEDRSDGSVVVLDGDGEQLDVVPPAEGGFIRGVMRGMFRTRKLESLPAQAPFELKLLVDGALVIEDPLSGRRVDLRSFGQSNHRAFARLLELGEAAG